ncbi:hypothetical protein I204_07622 [Kwoniella mangroviensis CBS 8886]|nr:hypothetical protein I204_07622 [Kwoniella mangroviensis CBS 8886]
MSSPSACVSPGPREPDFAGLANTSGIPPFFMNRSISDRWEMKPPLPLSQSRAYVSPDTSPLEERFENNQQCDSVSPTDVGLQPSLSNHPREFPHPGRPPLLPSETILPQQQPQQPNNRYFTNTLHHQGGFWQHNGNDQNDPWFNPMMLPQMNKQKKNKGQKKVEGKQPTFLTKLFGILEQPEYHHIIRWDETGEAIIIENPEELAEKILPVVYRQSRFASFSRQLNIYGFNRKLSLRHVERGICDPDASTWSHPFLKRHSTKAEILSFKRRVPPRPTQAQKRRMSLHEEGLSPTSSEHSVDFHSPPDAYQHHLLPDVEEDKPFIFPHPRGSFLPQGLMGYQGTFHAHAPPPEYHAYEQNSPTAFEFDYSTPEEADRRSPTIPYPQQRPFHMLKIQPLTVFNHTDQRLGHDLGPQSAPANTTAYPIDIKVTQQHTRTRSVQGEPPSAMLYSPSSPFNPSSWLTSTGIGDVPEPQPQQQQRMKKEESISPTSLPQRQFGGYAPHGQNIMNPNNHFPAWWDDKRGDNSYTTEYDNSPQSLPTNDFEPGSGSSNSLILPQIQTQLPPTGINQSQSLSILSPDSPTTISPGVYQPGFSFPPSPRSRSYHTHTPTPSSSFGKITTSTRQERRATLSSSTAPYPCTSPRNKVSSLLSSTLIGGNRTIASRRGSEAHSSALGLRLDGIDRKDGGNGDDDDEGNEALPSASIKFEDKHPFEGILGGEEIVD